MNKYNVAVAIQLNKREIAQEIDDCEYIQNNGGSDYEKERAKISAYERIRDLVLGDDKGV